MAIPTQFSVARAAKCPIANPLAPKDAPTLLDAENVSIVGGASTIGALSVGEINAPTEFTPESLSVIDSATVIDAESVQGIDTPDELTAKSAQDVDSATLIGAESVQGVDTPSAVSAKAKVDVDTPSNIGAEGAALIDTPSAVSAKNAQAVDAPTLITPNTGTPTSPPFPLNHARILYKNLLQSGSVTSTWVSSTPSYALTPDTAERWSFTSGLEQSMTVELPSNEDMDTFCIGAHNGYQNGIATRLIIEYSTSTGGSFVEVYNDVPESQAPIMAHLSSSVSVRRVRFTFSASASREKYIGYVSAGVALQMQRPFFNGHQPFVDGDVTEYYSNRTESGERIGRIIRRKGFQTSFAWENIDDGWYRQYIPEFKEYAKVVPFFVAWNLLEYPNDIAFGETVADIKAPMQNGFNTMRSGLSFDLVGL